MRDRERRPRAISLADLEIIEIVSGPTRVGRLPRVRRDDGYALVLQLAGRARCRHAGRDVLQQPFDLVLVDRALPLEIDYPERHHVVVFDIPRGALRPMVPAADRLVGRRLSGGEGSGTVLASYARALAREAGRLDPAVHRGWLVHLCGLVALAFREPPAAVVARRAQQRAAKRQQILAYLESRLADAGLSAASAARDLGISRRWLHALLGESGMTFAGWIARRRLEEARRRLTDPCADHLSVAAIAFEAGFNDVSTFNRRFRARYGTTPRALRRRGPTGARSRPPQAA